MMALGTQDPSRAVITSVGAALDGGVANSTTPVIKGTADAGDTVTIYDGVRALGTAMVGIDGSWSFTPSAALKGGIHSFAAIAQDSQGNFGASSVPLSVQIGATVVTPVAPGITELTDNVGGITGPITNGMTTDDSRPVLTGTGTAGNTITVYDGATLIGTTTVAGNGTWSLRPATALTDGAHDVFATQSNSAGTSPHSTDISFKVDTSTPATPAAPTLTDDSNALIPAGSSTTDGHPHISGTGTAGDIITVYDGATVLGTATVGHDGKWTFTPATDLVIGGHSISVTEMNAAGTTSAHSPDTGFTYGVAPTETVTITNLLDTVSAANTYVSNNGLVLGASPTVQGSLSSVLQTGETVALYRDNALIGTATVNGSTWSYKDSGVTGGYHTYTAKVVSGGLAGVTSNTFGFTESTSSGGQVWNVSTSGYQTIYIDITGMNLAGLYGAGSLWTNTAYANNPGATATLTSRGNNIYSYGWGYTTPKGVEESIFWKTTNGTLYLIDDKRAESSWNLVGFNVHLPVSGGVWAPAVPVQSVSAVHQTDDQALIGSSDQAKTDDSTTTNHHTAVSEHDTFVGHAANGNETVDLNANPASYFKETTAHIQGSGGTAIDTLHLTGDHQVLDLTSLTGQTAAAKISGIEVIDLGGHTNNLKLSLTDVLNLGEQDLFQKDGHQQLMVKGSNGDTVDLSNAHIAGVADGQWQAEGTAVVGGVTYNVYEHSGAHTELLVQQGVQIALHN
ncbi:Ig-like domain-containing protein [Caballeronia sp. LjRoot34]|uniref:Ig-like domain-containing protein n=1 Tax=Caballeronia sp. LjRoot34 TaxID=3342325 RepID=UPI003ED0DB98